MAGFEPKLATFFVTVNNNIGTPANNYIYERSLFSVAQCSPHGEFISGFAQLLLAGGGSSRSCCEHTAWLRPVVQALGTRFYSSARDFDGGCFSQWPHQLGGEALERSLNGQYFQLALGQGLGSPTGYLIPLLQPV